MSFPNDPTPSERRALSRQVGRRGWVFGLIILLAVIGVVVAFTWAGNEKSATNTSNAPTTTTGAGGSPSTAPGAPAAPVKR